MDGDDGRTGGAGTDRERADVGIVGAGIAGLTTAYLLTKEGKRVIVVDDGPTAGGDTCRTTAHLVSALDARFYELERHIGQGWEMWRRWRARQ